MKRRTTGSRGDSGVERVEGLCYYEGMRIWHEKLIPKLCQKHICGVWREALGAYKIITEDKKGYRNHPAVKEFENAAGCLWERLHFIREEMLRRGYHPKELPAFVDCASHDQKEWQTLEQQIEILKTKGCKCHV